MDTRISSFFSHSASRQAAILTFAAAFYAVPAAASPDSKNAQIISHIIMNADKLTPPLDLDYESIQTGVPEQNGISPNLRVDTPLGISAFAKSSVPDLPRNEAIFPDPFGWNTKLRDRGIAIMLDNTNEFSGAITPPTRGYGLKQGSSNAGQYSLETDIDWETLAGIRGFATHTIMVGRYGIPASRMFGDNLNPSSEIYGGGGNVFVHLVYAYGEETLLNGRISIAGGRMSFLSDFSANPLYCTFMNNSFCGNPKASSDNTAHASYPDANWALRIRVRPSDDTYFQTGVYFTQSQSLYKNTQFRTGFKFNGADIDGQAVPVEFGWEPIFGHHKLPGHYKIGFAADTAPHADTFYDDDGNAYARTGKKPRMHHSSWSAWLLADQMIMRHHLPNGHDGGLILVGAVYVNNPRTQTRAQHYSLGVIDTGFWASRPLDTIGVNFSYGRVSSGVARTQAIQQEMGLPLLNDSFGPQTYFEVLEATYRIHVMRGVTFAPDFQYFFRPGAQKVLRDAAVLGFKSHIQFF